MRQADVVVVGGGPAGLAAAISARKQGAEKVLILERDRELGGILQQCIHNGFGLHYFGQELTGPEYAGRFIEELEKTDIEVLTDCMVLEVTPERHVYAIHPREGLILIQASAVVLAMGCRERTRGALAIPGTRPSGVYTAGTAQRLVNMEGFLPGRKVVVLGSGDIGLIMARRMIWEGADVLMVCEVMPFSNGLKRNIVQCLDDFDIPLRFSHTVVAIHGRDRLTGVTVARVDEKMRPIAGTEELVECDTLLLSVGLIPENELTQQAGVGIDAITNGALVDQWRQTDMPGIFSCGNVLHVHDLVDHVSNEANIAGQGAARWAMEAGKDVGQEKQTLAALPVLPVQPGNGVRYVVPQRVTVSENMPNVSFSFRVNKVYRKAQVEVRVGERVLCGKRRAVCLPGEMETIEVDGNLLVGVKGSLEIGLAVKEEET